MQRVWPYCEKPMRGNNSIRVDAETTPLRNPEHYQFDFNLRDVAEVWRRGSVIASWLLDLTATALAWEIPSSSKFAGQVSDSGEGRWTIKAAIDEAVPVPVLSAALYDRFGSRGPFGVPEQGALGHALRVRRTYREGCLGMYQPVENYGVIGDLHSIALVGMNGSIDWYCFPHFDSPSVFARILDDKKGGYFQIAAANGAHQKQLYWPDECPDHAFFKSRRRRRGDGLHAGRRRSRTRRFPSPDSPRQRCPGLLHLPSRVPAGVQLCQRPTYDRHRKRRSLLSLRKSPAWPRHKTATTTIRERNPRRVHAERR